MDRGDKRSSDTEVRSVTRKRSPNSRSRSPMKSDAWNWPEKKRSTSKSSPVRKRSRSNSSPARRRSYSRGSPARRRSNSRGSGGRRKSRSRSPRSRNSRDYKKRYNSRSRSRSRSRESSPNPDGYRLHIADLDEYATKRDLEKVFMKFGPLKEIWLASYAPFYAFIVFWNKHDAEDARYDADGANIAGRRIRVTIARPRRRPGQRYYRSRSRSR